MTLTEEECQMQIIPDPECAQFADREVYTTDLAEIEGTQTSYAAESYVFDAGSAVCPRSITGSVTGLFRDPKTGYTYEFNSRGTWTIDWLSSAIYLASSQAVYNWPQGEWPAFNLDHTVGPAFVQIRQGRGVCLGGGNVTFIRFYGVNLRDDNIYKRTSGSGGGGAQCTTEYIIIEINYGDGTGWHVLWAGYATVCG